MVGTIAAKIEIQGGSDPITGEPLPVHYDWGEVVECMYSAIELNYRGRYADGDFLQASYVVTTDDMNFDGTYVLLKDSRGNMVCEKEVISLEVLEDIQRVKIVL
jgi:hypothetical protein